MTGIFISFEGIDGAGKSSHIEALADAFRAQAERGVVSGKGQAKRGVVLTREPGGTALAERLREMILHEPMDALTEVLLVFAARREHVLQVIAPALARGDVVLCDRFTDASFAYQGAGRGFSPQVLSFLEQQTQYIPGRDAGFPSKTTILQPDLTLLFDVPPAVASQRLATARQPDKFEAQDVAFFERVAAGYAARMQLDAAAGGQRFVRIDGHAPREQVRASVMAALKARGYLQ
jgi:dTMP kinase